jgi:hypothetical protein
VSWYSNWCWRAGAVGIVGACLPITPTFVLPYKRYASSSLLPLAKSYLENDQQSYQRTVEPGGVTIGYVTRKDQSSIDERRLRRSTLHRWVFWLGAQLVALRVGIQLWGEHDPQSALHRFVGAVAPHKYRSPRAEQILKTARQLLHLIDHWDRTFPEKFFPRFATRARPP